MNYSMMELVWLLLIYSFLGWVVETIVGTVKKHLHTVQPQIRALPIIQNTVGICIRQNSISCSNSPTICADLSAPGFFLPSTL